MSELRCAIVGAGVLGRTIALALHKAGCTVEIFDPRPDGGASTASRAGGMLAPDSELESAEPIVYELGIEGLDLWRSLSDELGEHGFSIGWVNRGSLIVAHPQDRPQWLELTEKISKRGKNTRYEILHPQSVEPQLDAKISEGLYLPDEAHVSPSDFMRATSGFLLEHDIPWHHVEIHDINSRNHKKTVFKNFDWIIDSRGIGAKNEIKNLRGVRGEAVLVHAPEVCLTRPVRVVHPRYALYIVPRTHQNYYLGATQIESDDESPIAVRSTLEILSAAFAIDPKFAEARILQSMVGIRPAFPDNAPFIRQKGELLQVNGLFRHGFLLAPAVAKRVVKLISNNEKEHRSISLLG
ncbi:MAG: FAD-dependent oxidoreductase [Pseudobacteriovorax sp.]|nr:FAD-dependent oxidoreductase [Pseudobacteriovorax sp.]